ncbi:hypothetical protein MKY15_21770 [Sporosarcina sp. FSL K6-1540]|uniref:hypothetical protein n=1 Tax=Sporosarcina sp. FSL K6-1540 TaxID=2921555 RepID=UPI00315B183F
MRVSELVTIDEINKWEQGDIITIKAGTGAGKSYFIKNNLHAIAERDGKRILMLIHRTNCTKQFLMEIEAANKTDVIDIRTYQSIEAAKRNRVIYNLDLYDFIICDEWHYWMGDANFNRQSDLSLNAILNQTKAIRIFMSATGDTMKYYLTDKKHLGLSTVDYELPIDFNFIKHLEFFYKDETFETYIEQAIKHKRKAIFFVQSAAKAYALHEKYKEHSLFNCGKGSNFHQFVDKEKINKMLLEEKFNELILFTTTVMDAGVNIVDDELNHIVIDVNDTGSLIQCIGRKRLKNKNDYIVLHVKAIGGRQLGGIETRLLSKIKMPLHLFKNGDKSMVGEYFRTNENSEMIYDILNEDGNIEKKLNELMFFKVVADVTEIDRIKSLGKYGYCLYLSKLFKLPYSIYEEEEKKDSLMDYIDSVVGKRLFKENQKELIERIDLRVDGKQQKSYTKLNEGLEMIKLPFIIIPKKSGSMRYWLVEKMEI